MGGSKAPDPPDYGPIASANKEAAELAAKVAREQLAWAKEQYGKDRELTDRVLGVVLPAMEADIKSGQDYREQIMSTYLPMIQREDAFAQEQRARYKQTFQPIEDEFAAFARGYATPERMEREAGRAAADVSTAFEQQRQNAAARLEGFGIDPSQVRGGALDLSLRAQEAAAQAGAANSTRQQIELTGQALRGEAINVGRGIAANTAASYQAAQGAGGQGLNSAGQMVQGGYGAGQGAIQSNLATTGSMNQGYAGAQGWQGLQNQSLSNWGKLLSEQYQGELQAYQTKQSGTNAMWGALGSVAGAAGTTAIMMSDERLKTDVVRVGTHRSGVPWYRFRFLWDAPGTVREGAMAREVARIAPHAVFEQDGWLMIDYRELGG